MLGFTGLSGAVKSTLAHDVESRLHENSCRAYVQDGDNVRHGLCSDLGFSAFDRTENIRRIGEVNKWFTDAGLIVLTAFISPDRNYRAKVRAMIGDEDFIEICCCCDLKIFEQHDLKGQYAKAWQGIAKEFTGISSTCEAPLNPELEINMGSNSLENCVDIILSFMKKRGVIAHVD